MTASPCPSAADQNRSITSLLAFRPMNLGMAVRKRPDEVERSVEMNLCVTRVVDCEGADHHDGDRDQGHRRQAAPTVARVPKAGPQGRPDRAGKPDASPRQHVRERVLQNLTIGGKQRRILQARQPRGRIRQCPKLSELGCARLTHLAFRHVGVSLRVDESLAQSFQALAHDASHVAAGRTASITARRNALRSLTMRRASLKPYSFWKSDAFNCGMA